MDIQIRDAFYVTNEKVFKQIERAASLTAPRSFFENKKSIFRMFSNSDL